MKQDFGTQKNDRRIFDISHLLVHLRPMYPVSPFLRLYRASGSITRFCPFYALSAYLCYNDSKKYFTK